MFSRLGGDLSPRGRRPTDDPADPRLLPAGALRRPVARRPRPADRAGEPRPRRPGRRLRREPRTQPLLRRGRGGGGRGGGERLVKNIIQSQTEREIYPNFKVIYRMLVKGIYCLIYRILQETVHPCWKPFDRILFQ